MGFIPDRHARRSRPREAGSCRPRLTRVIADLYRQRALVWAFANRDFSTRYRSSVLGWAWSLLQPLATLLVYAAVFSLVFRIQAPPLGADPDRTSFAAFLFTGMVTFNLFSGLLMLSMTQLRSNGELLRKVHFPAWTPILGASIVQLVQVALEIIVLIAMFLWLGNIGISWLLAIPVLLATAMFGQGIGLMLAVLNARFGDVQYIVQVVLQALYFLTPILYPLALVESTANWLAWIVKANPLTWFVETMHQVMYSLVFPQWWVVPGLLVLGFVVFWAGFTIFNRTSEDIGELL
jgi:ABC-type polysaccharide/polyol phosphate export permease